MINQTFNHTFNGTAEPGRYNEAEKIIILIVMVLMSIASTFGNVLVFVAYYKVKSLQRPTNYFILSLALADFIVATFVVNFHTMYMVIDWPYPTLNYHVCLLWLTVDYWVFQVSVFGVLIIAGDRYFSIKFPNGYRERRTKRRVIYVIIGNWIISFLIWVPLILAYGKQKETEEEMVGQKYCDVGSKKIIPATVIGCLVSYVLPIFIILYFAIDSVHILLKMKKKFNRKKSTPMKPPDTTSPLSSSNDLCTKPVAAIHNTVRKRNESDEAEMKEQDVPVPSSAMTSPEKEKKKKRQSFSPSVRLQSFSKSLDEYQSIATFTMILGITFIVNILPFGVLAVTRSVCLHVTGVSCVSTEWWYFGYIMCYLNSMLNPVCYAVGNKNFKRAFKSLLCRKTAPNRTASFATSEDSAAVLRQAANTRSLDDLNQAAK